MDSKQQQRWARVLSAGSSTRTAPDRESMLDLAVGLGADVAPAVVGCSVTEVLPGGGRTPAWAGEVALDLDLVQYEENLGPCLAAARERRLVTVDIPAGGPDFPAFTAAAQRRGIRSTLSLPVLDGPRPTALNLYAAETTAFGDTRARAVAGLLARCISGFLSPGPAGAETPADALAAALARREEIRQAQAILGAREGLEPVAAYDELVRRSCLEARGIHAVARDVIGELGS